MSDATQKTRGCSGDNTDACTTRTAAAMRPHSNTPAVCNDLPALHPPCVLPVPHPPPHTHPLYPPPHHHHSRCVPFPPAPPHLQQPPWSQPGCCPRCRHCPVVPAQQCLLLRPCPRCACGSHGHTGAGPCPARPACLPIGGRILGPPPLLASGTAPCFRNSALCGWWGGGGRQPDVSTIGQALWWWGGPARVDKHWSGLGVQEGS